MKEAVLADDDNSEEKKHPASQKKLKKQREKGQVAKSKEALSSVVLTAGMLFLFFSIGRLREMGLLLFDIANLVRGDDYIQSLKQQVWLQGYMVVTTVIPILLFVSVAAIAVSVLLSQGFLFTTEQLKPDFNRFNPVKGLKNIFSLQSIKTFFMNMVRLSLAALLAFYMVKFFIQSIFLSGRCGFDCGAGANAIIFFYVISALIVALLLFSILDFLVQRSEFLRQNKMTDTEQKQERKEQYGTPEIKGRMREIRQEVATKTVGFNYASFIVADGLNRAIAVRYVRGGDQPPLVVAKARGREAVMQLISRSGKPVEHSREIVLLLSKIEIGNPILDEVAINNIVPYLLKHT